MQLSDLLDALTALAWELNPNALDVTGVPLENDPEVLLAHQPSWPFELSISKVVLHDPLKAWDREYGPEPAHDDPNYEAWLDDRQREESKGKTIYIAEGGNQQYLVGGVAALLGWR